MIPVPGTKVDGNAGTTVPWESFSHLINADEQITAAFSLMHGRWALLSVHRLILPDYQHGSDVTVFWDAFSALQVTSSTGSVRLGTVASVSHPGWGENAVFMSGRVPSHIGLRIRLSSGSTGMDKVMFCRTMSEYCSLPRVPTVNIPTPVRPPPSVSTPPSEDRIERGRDY